MRMELVKVCKLIIGGIRKPEPTNQCLWRKGTDKYYRGSSEDNLKRVTDMRADLDALRYMRSAKFKNTSPKKVHEFLTTNIMEEAWV